MRVPMRVRVDHWLSVELGSPLQPERRVGSIRQWLMCSPGAKGRLRGSGSRTTQPEPIGGAEEDAKMRGDGKFRGHKNPFPKGLPGLPFLEK